MIYQWHVSTQYDPEHYLEIPKEADACQSYKAEYDSASVPGIQSYKNYNAEYDANSTSANLIWTDATTKINFRINTE
jgi:hypothetical protein